MLAVALHRQLLEIRGKAFQIIFVRQYRHGFCAKEIRVPDRKQPHDHRQIIPKRRGAEMFVHLVKSVEHRAEMFWPDRQHRRKADGRIHRVASPDPVPKAEHVRRINAERGHLLGIGRDGYEMFRHGFFISAQTFQQPVARAFGVRHGFQRRERF